MPAPLCQVTGRRKSSVARVVLRYGEGNITVNDRPFEEYFPSLALQMSVTEPLRAVNAQGKYDVVVNISGGGVAGQAGALVHALGRALSEVEPEDRTTLKRAGFLTRDARVKERKKYGLKKARKAPQYSKR